MRGATDASCGVKSSILKITIKLMKILKIYLILIFLLMAGSIFLNLRDDFRAVESLGEWLK